MVEEKKKKGSNFGGSRPPKYQPIFDNIIKTMIIADGEISDAKLAQKLGVTKSTFHRWRFSHESFRNAYNEAWDHVAVYGAERTLLKRALGYEYTEEIIEDKQAGQYPGVDTKILKKHMPPDVRALELVLKNRAAKRWPKGEAHESGSLTINITRDDDNAGTQGNQLQASPDTLSIHEG